MDDDAQRDGRSANLQATAKTLEAQVARRTELLTLLHELAAAANQASAVEEILAVVLQRISEHDGWVFAQAYFVAEAEQGSLVLARSWRASVPDRFAAFRDASRTTVRVGDDELLHRAVTSREPTWVSDVGRELSDARTRAAEEAGLEYALVVPVLSGDDVVCLMEFFADKAIQAREARIEARAIRSIAASVARVYERQTLERELARVAIDEHRRIGQELHDSLSQQLTALEMLARTLAGKADFETERFERLLTGIHEARRQVRAMIRGLVPVEVEAGGLRDGLDDLAQQTSGEQKVDCRFTCRQPISVADPAATHLYHIAREAVHNAVKHARPTVIRITLRHDDDSLILRIADDGGGPTQSHRNTIKGGLGLQIMEYRARMIDGTLAVQSDGPGVTVTCTAPIGWIKDV